MARVPIELSRSSDCSSKLSTRSSLERLLPSLQVLTYIQSTIAIHRQSAPRPRAPPSAGRAARYANLTLYALFRFNRACICNTSSVTSFKYNCSEGSSTIFRIKSTSMFPCQACCEAATRWFGHMFFVPIRTANFWGRSSSLISCLMVLFSFLQNLFCRSRKSQSLSSRAFWERARPPCCSKSYQIKGGSK